MWSGTDREGYEIEEVEDVAARLSGDYLDPRAYQPAVAGYWEGVYMTIQYLNGDIDKDELASKASEFHQENLK